MRTRRLLGCIAFTSSSLLLHCADFQPASSAETDASAETDGATTMSSSGRGPSSSSGENPGCDAEAAACPPTADGVFVASRALDGDSGTEDGGRIGDGSRERPFATLSEALATSAPRIFVCKGTYSEALTLTGAVAIHGGYDCASWQVGGGVTLLTAPANTIPVRIEAGAGVVRLHDVSIHAADATGLASGPIGASSVAVLTAWSQDVALFRCTVSAGAGAAGGTGADGATPERPQASSGNRGRTCACEGGTSSTGGDGTRSGDASTAGSSLPAVAQPAVNGGSNATGGTPCTVGREGASATGSEEPAALETRTGSLNASGWIGVLAGSGGHGFPGQGGGGGGATSDPGGAGGCGGCGGTGGSGGGAGGSSLALVSANSSLRLHDTSLASGAGGNGGTGGKGGSGTMGGLGEDTSTANIGCGGGLGGEGSAGAGGNGGAAGLAVCVAYTGSPPQIDGAVVPAASSHPRCTTPTKSWQPGPGGAGSIPGHSGFDPAPTAVMVVGE